MKQNSQPIKAVWQRNEKLSFLRATYTKRQGRIRDISCFVIPQYAKMLPRRRGKMTSSLLLLYAGKGAEDVKAPASGQTASFAPFMVRPAFLHPTRGYNTGVAAQSRVSWCGVRTPLRLHTPRPRRRECATHKCGGPPNDLQDSNGVGNRLTCELPTIPPKRSTTNDNQP